ncbi:MAG: DMT family transporter [Clostridia bacterium]|nr:DMT family transporter [Clostridia bacterium]
MNDRSFAASGIVFTSISALIYGMLPIMTNLSFREGSNAETFNLFKSAWAIPVLGAVLIIKRQSIRLPRRLACRMVLAGIMGKGITSLLLYASYNTISSGMATTLHFLYPIFAAMLGRLVLKRALPRYKWLALVVATLSVALLVDPAGGGSPSGIVCAAASGAVYAAYILMVDATGIAVLDPLVFAFYLAVSGSGFSLAYGLCTGTLRFGLSAGAHLYMALAAVSTSIAAAALLQQGIRRLGGTTAAIFSLFEPVSSCVFGALFLGERMSARAVGGIALILGAVLYMIVCDLRTQRARLADR